MWRIRSVRLTFVSILILFVSACGGGGGGGSSTATSAGSSGGSSTSASIDATGREIAAGFMQSEKTGAASLSSAVGANTSAFRMNARIDIIPIMSGDTMVGATMNYVDQVSVGEYGGSTILNGTVVGYGDAAGGDAQSEGLTRRFDALMSASGKWEFDGTADVDMRGSLYAASSSPFMIGVITDTLNDAMGMTATNTSTGEVYIFDDLRIQVNLSGDSLGQSVKCSQEPSSFILMHKQGSGSVMSCILNSDCSACM